MATTQRRFFSAVPAVSVVPETLVVSFYGNMKIGLDVFKNMRYD
jgi:hypothetical protein